MNIYTENVSISPFDPQVDNILNSISFNDEIRQILAAYHILDYKSFKQLDKKQLLNIIHNVNGTVIKFSIHRVVESIKYIRFYEANYDYNLAADPTS